MLINHDVVIHIHPGTLLQTFLTKFAYHRYKNTKHLFVSALKFERRGRSIFAYLCCKSKSIYMLKLCFNKSLLLLLRRDGPRRYRRFEKFKYVSNNLNFHRAEIRVEIRCKFLIIVYPFSRRLELPGGRNAICLRYYCRPSQ